MSDQLNPSWSTQESKPLHMVETLLYRGIAVGCVAYGLHVAIFFACMYFLFKGKRSWTYRIYVIFIFGLGTAMISCQARFGELAWVDERNYPTGPLGFILNEGNIASNIAGDAVANTITLAVDSMLIYRCYIVWNSSIYAVVVPTLMLIASTITSILRTIAAAQPGSSLFSKHAVKFGLAYWSLSLSLNILVTIIIASRLIIARNRLRGLMGDEHADTYVGIASMIVESALPYAIFSLATLIPYERGTSAQSITSVLISILPQVQCISPQIIIIRVSLGRGWSKDTLSNGALSVIRFQHTTNPNTTEMQTTDAESGNSSTPVIDLTTKSG